MNIIDKLYKKYNLENYNIMNINTKEIFFNDYESSFLNKDIYDILDKNNCIRVTSCLSKLLENDYSIKKFPLKVFGYENWTHQKNDKFFDIDFSYGDAEINKDYNKILCNIHRINELSKNSNYFVLTKESL